MGYVAYDSNRIVKAVRRTETQIDAWITDDGNSYSKSGDITIPVNLVGPDTHKLDSGGTSFTALDQSDLTDAEVAADLKEIVKGLVQVFDRDLKFHWAGQASATNVKPTADISTATSNIRYNNTDVWARAWIGAAWRECDRLENAHTRAMSLENVRKIVAQAKAEIDIGIRTWYAVHNTSDWEGWLFLASGNYSMYRTNTSTGSGIVMTDPSMTYTQADWTDLIGTQFFAAFAAAG